MKKCVIVVPACNEAASIEYFLPRLRGEIKKIASQTVDFDVVVIDDGSTDETCKVVQGQGCRLLRNDGNRGLGYSLRRGYQLVVDAGYDFLVSMDSDGQHDPRLLASVLAPLEGGTADLVTASRYHPESDRYSPPLDRDMLNIAVTAMIRAVTGWKHITDPLTGFWAMNSRVAEFLAKTLKLERYGTCLEGLIKMWHLMTPQPRLLEIPHPAIYANHGPGFLNRVYSPGQMEDRIDRFGTHARQIILALQDVQSHGHSEEVEGLITAWRRDLLL